MQTVLIITNIPTPYRIPLFNELADQLREKHLHLKVVFAALGYARRKWVVDMSDCTFDYEVLSGSTLGSNGKENLTFKYKGLYRLIKKESPCAIVTNEFSLATTKLWLCSFFSSIPFIIWSGAISGIHHQISPYRNLQRRLLVGRANSYVAYGSAAKDNLVKLGADQKNVSIAINTVDTKYFSDESAKWRRNSKQSAKFIYVGHLTKGKRLDLLLQAVHIVRNKGKEFCIVIIGEGPELDKLKELAEELGIDEIVSFEGFKQKNDIPKYMGEASCFIFPSEYDVWGLVLVEAMACGLPCIASILSGATRDLIIEGKTGFALNFSDTKAVAERMSWVIENTEVARSMGAMAREYIEKNVNLGVSAKGFVNAIENCLKNK